MGLSSELNEIKNRDAKKPAKRRGYKLNDFRKLPRKRWQVTKHLKQGQTTIYYGQPGCKKTFIALNLAASISNGTCFLDDPRFRVTVPGRVVYICGEGDGDFRNRLDAYEFAGHRLDNDNFVVVPHTFDFGTDTEVGEFVTCYRETVGDDVNPVLVVIDTVSQCFGGDENSAGAVSALLNNVKRIKDAFGGCSVVLLHHQPKATETSDPSTFRGSGAFEGNVDNMFYLHTDNADEHLIHIERKKFKDGRCVTGFAARSTEHELGYDEDDEIVTSLSVQIDADAVVQSRLKANKEKKATTLERMGPIYAQYRSEILALTSQRKQAAFFASKWEEFYPGEKASEEAIRKQVAAVLSDC